VEDGTIKEAKDKWEELPQPEFRKLWSDMVEFWKINLEEVISIKDGITWDYEHIRPYRIKIDWKNGKPIMVEYIAEVTAEYGETAKIPTPPMQPGMQSGEIDKIQSLADAAKDFLHGERSQQSLDFDSEEEVSSETGSKVDDEIPFD
jgi:hypothetical protein